MKYEEISSGRLDKLGWKIAFGRWREAKKLKA
jgi:hypothetical protein